jgi:hypothetical protein
MNEIKPLLVDVRQARALLACGKNSFWKNYAPKLELLGTVHKRLVTVSSIEALVEQLRQGASRGPRKRAFPKAKAAGPSRAPREPAGAI